MVFLKSLDFWNKFGILILWWWMNWVVDVFHHWQNVKLRVSPSTFSEHVMESRRSPAMDFISKILYQDSIHRSRHQFEKSTQQSAVISVAKWCGLLTASKLWSWCVVVESWCSDSISCYQCSYIACSGIIIYQNEDYCSYPCFLRGCCFCILHFTNEDVCCK